MNIEVTQGDIDAGIPNCAIRCPVALALQRVTRQEWWVGHDELDPYFGEDYTGDEIPREVKRFIRRFDALKSVKPFSFELDWRDPEATEPN